MNWRSIGAVVYKDLLLFFRNRFFAVMTVAGLIAYMAIYFVMPGTVDETLKIGLYAPSVPAAPEYIHQGDAGIEVQEAESEEALKEDVMEGRYVTGIVLPEDFADRIAAGLSPDITAYVASDAPDEVKEFIGTLLTEVAYSLTGQTLDIDWQQEILGKDMVGSQIPQRDRMRSLFAVLLIVAETFSLATLLSEEVERRTVTALLVTPMTVKDLFIAKGILGIMLAFGQTILFLAVVRGMTEQPLIIVVVLLLGSALVTALGFLMASVSKDFLSVVSWGIPIMVTLSVPAIAVMTPGAESAWIKALPSYYLVDTINMVSNFEAGWSDIWRNLLILAAFVSVLSPASIIALRRRFQ